MSSRRSSVQSLTTSLPHLDLLWAGLQIAQSNRFLNTCNYTLLYLTTTRLCEPFGTILRMSRTRFHAFCSTSSRSPTHHPNVKIKTPLNTHLRTSTYTYHPTCRATSPQLNHTSSQVQYAFTNVVTSPDTPSKTRPHSRRLPQSVPQLTSTMPTVTNANTNPLVHSRPTFYNPPSFYRSQSREVANYTHVSLMPCRLPHQPNICITPAVSYW
jgi:hypothetical protein